MKRIVIAEDNHALATVLKLALEAEGYEVYLAENGVEALGVQRRARAHILITDIVMPEGDGFETLDAFRKEFPLTKVVVVSGTEKLNARHYLRVARMLGADATFQKPFDVDALLRRLKTL